MGTMSYLFSSSVEEAGSVTVYNKQEHIYKLEQIYRQEHIYELEETWKQGDFMGPRSMLERLA